MFSIIRKINFLVGLTLCVIVNGFTQTVTSTKNGIWTDPSLWDGGLVPTLANATEIVINHDVAIPDGSIISIRNVVLNGMLTLGPGTVVDLIPDALIEKWDLQIFGRFTLQDGAVLNGTSIANTSFESGARYVHLQGPLGYIPYATWNSNSTFEIAGFRTQGYINIAHSDSWKQNFGHVIYNCTQQITAFVDLNGYLRNIGGNFIIQSTNNQALRLSTTQNPSISIAGDFIIEGPSKVWFSTNPTNAIIDVQKDFRYRSSSAGISYLTTKGVIAVNVQGEMEMNSPGRFHMASTSLDSTGTRIATLSLRGDFKVTAGSIVGPPSPGKGKINFVGSGVQNVTTPPGVGTFQGTLDYLVESSSTVNMKNSVISNSAGTLVVKGKLQLGSSAPGGAIQLTNGGNIQVQGSRTFETGCTIEYNGLAEQWIGSGHPSAQGVHLICSNPAGVTMLKEIVANDVTILGKFGTQAFPLTSYGNITIAPDIECTIEHLNVRGGLAQQISAGGATFKNLVIDKSANAVTLSSPLKISQSLVIASTNTTLYSNGNLTLLSTSDAGLATAGVGTLPTGSSVDGNVTVQRHMDAEGRIYRYISSPIQNGSISSLKDDFPITGRFQDPSTGPGLSPTRPSFFYYDQSRGGLQASWIPYPNGGLSSTNPLVVGRGYAAYIQTGSSPIIWDVTGPLNQGTIALPVNYTTGNQPAMGWNLVGNPYACAIQWDENGADKWTIENISSVIAVRDNGGGGGTVRYWDLGDSDPEIPGGQIATGQAFWVRATDNNPKLTIREGVKAMGGATFFRKERSTIPSFALELSRDALKDIAYFKIRPTSKSGLDNWDGVKMDNDNFDISFISTDKQSLAIHATDKFPCDTTIQMGLKDLVPGWYKLRLITKNDFSRYQFTLLDKFLHTEILLTADETIPLVVTSDPASYAFDRISVRMVELAPNAEIELIGNDRACIGSVAKVIISDAEPYVLYSAWSGSKKLSEARADRMGDLEINFVTDSLSRGSHQLTFQAQSSCHLTTLLYSPTITIFSTPDVLVSADTACVGSTATLTAFSDQQDVTFHWFGQSDSNDTLSTGYSFETAPLTKTTVYYVSASSKWACSSQRFAVQTLVKTFREASITVLGDSMLSSNYAIGNRWYLNSILIEDASGSNLQMKNPGMYMLRVDTMGCLTQDTITYIISQAEPSYSSLQVYPNPASDFIYIKNGIGIRQVAIWDALGKLVLIERLNLDGSDISVNIDKLTQGVYIGVIFSRQKKWIFRFVKAGK